MLSPLRRACVSVSLKLFSWVGVIMYLPADDMDARRRVTDAFLAYRDLCKTQLWDRCTHVVVVPRRVTRIQKYSSSPWPQSRAAYLGFLVASCRCDLIQRRRFECAVHWAKLEKPRTSAEAEDTKARLRRRCVATWIFELLLSATDEIQAT